MLQMVLDKTGAGKPHIEARNEVMHSFHIHSSHHIHTFFLYVSFHVSHFIYRGLFWPHIEARNEVLHFVFVYIHLFSYTYISFIGLFSHISFRIKSFLCAQRVLAFFVYTFVFFHTHTFLS